jgi:hypothetical protein
MMLACACMGGDALSNPQLTDAEVAAAKLTDADLIKEYESAGLSVNGNEERKLTDEDNRLAFSVPNARLQAAQSEILQRGSQMVPALTAFLEQEAPKEREKDPATGLIISFTSDALGLLAQLGDPRAAPIALRILEGWDGKVNKWEQSAALRALERLTYFTFHKVRPHRSNYADSLQHPDAMDVESFTDCATPARLYREWMKGEGSDPPQWAEIARKRARRLLASDDLEQVYCAATFGDDHGGQGIGLPELSGEGPSQQRSQPQCALGCHSVFCSLHQ